MTEDKKIPTWGYSASGEAKLFHLGPKESLPSGWHDSPAKAKPVQQGASRKA